MTTTNSSDAASRQGFTVDYDDSRFPLVLIRAHGAATDAEFVDYLGVMERPLLRRERFVEIFDATYTAPSPAVQRRQVAEWIRERAGLLKTYQIGVAFVIPSALVRGALTAILWIQPHPSPHTVVATLAEAERWAIERARAEGLHVPPAPGKVAGKESAWTT